MCRRKVLAILPNRVSTILSHEPCFGVSTYSNRFGRVLRNVRVSLEMCEEWLSRITRIVQSAGYRASRSFSSSMNSQLRCRRSTRAVTWPSWRSSAARIEHVPMRLYSWSRATVGCLPATGGKSGAVLARACKPGFSSAETVIIRGVPPTGLHFAAQFPDKPTGRLSSSPQTRDHAFPDSTGLAPGVSPERREYDEQLPSPPWPATDALHLSHFGARVSLAASSSPPRPRNRILSVWNKPDARPMLSPPR